MSKWSEKFAEILHIISDKKVYHGKDDNWREEAKRILQNETSSPIYDYSHRWFGSSHYNQAISVIVPKNTEAQIEILWRIRSALPKNLFAFIGTKQWTGEEKHDGHELVVIQGENQYDIVYVANVEPGNYGLTSFDVVCRLKKYAEWCDGINIFQAETDTLQFTINKVPENLEAFAKDLYEFCPDCVDQGVGSLEALIEAARRDKYVYLWWD